MLASEAPSKHIPKGNMLLEEKRATHIVFDKGMVGQLKQRFHHAPEAVLRMPVIKADFTGLR